MRTTVALRNITKRYGDKTALESINLQVYEGEILALVGPNGSGKSTLLRILAFTESPTEGEVSFEDKLVTPEKREKVRLQSTLVFQRTTLFNTSVFNNVAYGLKIRKIPKHVQEKEVEEALRMVRLERFGKRHARRLSGGEQQRVALARALVLKTKLLLLDEPTANLDPKNASIVEEIITAINREFKTTIVMATHNMFQAEILPSRIALMNDGRIAEVGPPNEIFGKLSKNLASFAAVDNTFTGDAKITSSGITLVNIGNGVQIEATTQKPGEISLFVSPEDIIISRDQIVSSARNVYKGKITEVTDLGSLVKLKVDVGKTFTAQITKRSFAEMKLNLDSEVYITFKASSVQVL